MIDFYGIILSIFGIVFGSWLLKLGSSLFNKDHYEPDLVFFIILAGTLTLSIGLFCFTISIFS